MTALVPPNRRAATVFALALDTGQQAGNSALAPLLGVVDALQPLAAGAAPGPTAEFRDALRQRLLAAGATADLPTPARGGVGGRHGTARLPSNTLVTWRRRLVATGAGVTLAAGGMGGIATASTEALPGEHLYGVKRTVEDLRLSMAWSSKGKGERYLAQAELRLGEIELILGRTGPRPVETAVVEKLAATLGDMAASTETGSRLLTTAFDDTGDQVPLRVLTDFTQQQRGRLHALRPMLPVPLQTQPGDVLTLLDEIDDRVTERTDEEAGPLVGGNPGGAPGSPGNGRRTTTPSPTAAPSSSGAAPGGGASPSATSSGGPPPSSAPTGSPSPGPTGSPLPENGPSVGVTLPPLLPGPDVPPLPTPQLPVEPPLVNPSAATTASAPVTQSLLPSVLPQGMLPGNVLNSPSRLGGPGTVGPDPLAPLDPGGVPPLPGLPGVGVQTRADTPRLTVL